MTDAPTPNVGSSLVIIHQAISRGLSVAAEWSQKYAREGWPSAATGEGFTTYGRSLVTALQAHHLAEDEVAFPYAQSKGLVAPYAQLTAEHRAIEEQILAMATSLEEIAAGVEPAGPLTAMSGALVRILTMWRPHIQQEETSLSAAAMAALMLPEEHVQLGGMLAQHSQQHSRPDYLMVPFILYNLAPGERALMAAGMPAAVTQQLVPGPWKEKWAVMAPFLLA